MKKGITSEIRMNKKIPSHVWIENDTLDAHTDEENEHFYHKNPCK